MSSTLYRNQYRAYERKCMTLHQSDCLHSLDRDGKCDTVTPLFKTFSLSQLQASTIGDSLYIAFVYSLPIFFRTLIVDVLTYSIHCILIWLFIESNKVVVFSSAMFSYCSSFPVLNLLWFHFKAAFFSPFLPLSSFII